ncbi:TetR/AcrR family transcriptional regulator [Microbacterium sp. B2969]|uniref:TetR/AcrR family transcriptional regulator n=1 Tax=Microbacterium alkaliflavum TaxID=3248839 RepID=A0ABW7Q742_9MICO
MSAIEIAPRREPLSRERVLRTAIGIADSHGIQGLTMRRLAEGLGVEPMSIYYHVRGKDAIVSGAVDLLFVDVGARAASASASPDSGWRPVLRTRILAAREVMLEHPWVPRALESGGIMTPALATWINGNVAAMHDGGLSFDLIHHALHTLGSRQFGFSQELVLEDPRGADGEVDQQAAAELGGLMPHVAAMLGEVAHDDPDSTLGWCDDQAEFEFALDVLLEGIERRA